jgi:hypothetical protein
VANLPVPSRTRLHYFFDDFDILHKVAGLGIWTTVSTDAAGPIALADVDGGGIVLTAGTSDQDDTMMYNASENFTIESGKRMWYGIRMKGTGADMDDMGMQVGLSVATASAVSVTGANWIGFMCEEGDALVDFAITSGGARVAEALDIDGDLDLSFHTYEFEFDGVSNFKYYIDGKHIGTVATTSFPTTEMGPIIGIRAFTSTIAATLTVDWVYAAKERLTVND